MNLDAASVNAPAGSGRSAKEESKFAKQLDEQASGAITRAEQPAHFSPLAALSFWQRLWPFAALTLALVVNLLWIGALAYGLARLL